jgi:hypothetical protein
LKYVTKKPYCGHKIAPTATTKARSTGITW